MKQGEKEYRIALELPWEEICRSLRGKKHEDDPISISIWPIIKSRKGQKGERHGTLNTFNFSITKVRNSKQEGHDFHIEGVCLGNNKDFRAYVTPLVNSGYGILIM
ncbi:MAG: hypothetical protein WCG97_02180 [bacterium]